MIDENATAATADAGAVAPAQTVEDAAKTANVETTEATKAADTPETEKDVGDDDARDRKPSGYQRQREKALRAEMENAKLKAELDEIRRSLGDKAPIPGLGPEPKESDFTDFFEYQRKASAWEAARLLKSAEAASRETERGISERIQQEERIERLQASQEKARQLFEDYDKVVVDFQRSNVPVSPALIEEVLSSEKAELINYQLCKPENRSLLRELNQLDGKELIKAVARLEGRFAWPRAKTETKAPPPLSEVKGAAAARSPAQMTYKEWVKFREGGGTVSLGG